MIKTEITVERYSWRSYSKDAPRGSGYCKDQGSYQLLVKRWKYRGVTIFKQTLDREEIPGHVVIQLEVYGHYFGDWKSKFAEHVK